MMRRLIVAVSILFLFSGITIAGIATPGDVKIIQSRVLKSLMKPHEDDNEVAKLVNSIREDGTWPDIDYKDVSREGFLHTRHLDNMVLLARAYKVKPSNFYRSRKVKNTIELALKHWVKHDYICDNWWNNEIGTPTQLVNLMLIIGNDLSKELVEKAQPIIGRAHIDAPGARPGGDRIKIAGIQAKNMLFIGDGETFEKVIDVIENEIKYIEWIGREYGYSYREHEGGFSNRSSGGRGIQYGNSFHHRTDGVNNTLSYGLSYADSFIEWAVYTAHTGYAFSEDKIARLVDYYLDGICKMAAFGKYPDPGAKNREVSRRGSLRPFSTRSAEDLLKTTRYRGDELQEIANIRANEGVTPTLSHATFFWNTEHFAYQRPEWYTSVRMYSTRTYNMEVGYNSEGLLNHHRGDGTNHITRTGKEYDDIFPVFDYQKVPGATIMQKPGLPAPEQIQKLGLTDFVGAVTDGTYGAVAFDFKSPHDPLIARKSWFFFDDEYVCLGAGISCREPLPVVTTLNQCLLQGDVVVSSSNQQSVISKGEREYENVDWIFHDGIGYLFPESAKIGLMNQTAIGSWWNINKQISTPKGEVSKEVFKLWLDHGRKPSDATYEYIVIPATSLEKMQQYNVGEKIEIIANTPYIQAVSHTGIGICQALFYKGGEIKIGEKMLLTSDNPGIVMVKIKNGAITQISVSDPNRELTKFNLFVSVRIEGSGENWQATWNPSKGGTHIAIELPRGNYAGDSVTIEFL